MIRWLKRALWAAGFILLGYCGTSWIDSRVLQFEGNVKLDRLLRNRQEVQAPAAPPVFKPSHGELIGRIAVRRLGMSAVVFEGTDDAVLHRGVGHLTGSALPGQPGGNVVLAGHRDSFFRDLRNIREGDIVTVTTEFGTRSYSVETTKVVKPTDVGVEAPTRTPTLTLITCFPFNYIGSAPERFVIRGEDVADLSAARRQEPPPQATPADDVPQQPQYVSYAIYRDSSTAEE